VVGVPPGRSEIDDSARKNKRAPEAPRPHFLKRGWRWFRSRYVVRFEWRNKGYAEEAISDHLSGEDESGQARDRRGPG
jgi:hypothetical protein